MPPSRWTAPSPRQMPMLLGLQVGRALLLSFPAPGKVLLLVPLLPPTPPALPPPPSLLLPPAAPSLPRWILCHRLASARLAEDGRVFYWELVDAQLVDSFQASGLWLLHPRRCDGCCPKHRKPQPSPYHHTHPTTTPTPCPAGPRGRGVQPGHAPQGRVPAHILGGRHHQGLDLGAACRRRRCHCRCIRFHTNPPPLCRSPPALCALHRLATAHRGFFSFCSAPLLSP